MRYLWHLSYQGPEVDKAIDTTTSTMYQNKQLVYLATVSNSLCIFKQEVKVIYEPEIKQSDWSITTRHGRLCPNNVIKMYLLLINLSLECLLYLHQTSQCHLVCADYHLLAFPRYLS